jgi:ribosomal protein S18 acetylase RimI-like enzyme
VLVAEVDGERVGIVWSGPYPPRPDDPAIAWIYDIEVDERRRGQGLGRELLHALEQHLAAQGVAELSLNVFGTNDRARRLYATAGYREVAITMTKPLGAQPREDGR